MQRQCFTELLPKSVHVKNLQSRFILVHDKNPASKLISFAAAIVHNFLVFFCSFSQQLGAATFLLRQLNLSHTSRLFIHKGPTENAVCCRSGKWLSHILELKSKQYSCRPRLSTSCCSLTDLWFAPINFHSLCFSLPFTPTFHLLHSPFSSNQ